MRWTSSGDSIRSIISCVMPRKSVAGVQSVAVERAGRRRAWRGRMSPKQFIRLAEGLLRLGVVVGEASAGGACRGRTSP